MRWNFLKIGTTPSVTVAWVKLKHNINFVEVRDLPLCDFIERLTVSSHSGNSLILLHLLLFPVQTLSRYSVRKDQVRGFQHPKRQALYKAITKAAELATDHQYF